MSTSEDAPILICYDRSAGSREAIEHAARLVPGKRALVLNVWSYPRELAMYGFGASAIYSEDSQRATAAEGADEGCTIARNAGLEATPVTVCGSSEGTWRAILRVADERDVSLIVLGARGLGGLRSLFLGSVSHGVVHHAHRPVLVVPTGAKHEHELPKHLTEAASSVGSPQ